MTGLRLTGSKARAQAGACKGPLLTQADRGDAEMIAGNTCLLGEQVNQNACDDAANDAEEPIHPVRLSFPASLFLLVLLKMMRAIQ